MRQRRAEAVGVVQRTHQHQAGGRRNRAFEFFPCGFDKFYALLAQNGLYARMWMLQAVEHDLEDDHPGQDHVGQDRAGQDHAGRTAVSV